MILLAPLAIRIVPSSATRLRFQFTTRGSVRDLPTDDLLESLGTDTNPKERLERIRVVSAPVLKTVDLGLYRVIKTSRAFEEADKSTYKPSLGRWGSAVDVSDEVAT
jgi:hypothetical protein